MPARRRSRARRGRSGRAQGGGAAVSVIVLTARQVRYTNKAFWRNPASAFFTFAFPLMFLVIFTALLGSGTVHLAGRTVKESTYYVAAMAAFAVISACYTNVAMTVTFQRDAGILKRVDGTPLPAAVYFAGRVLHALFVAILLVVITAAFGRLAYQASVPTGITLVHFLVMLVVGAGSFCGAGFRDNHGDPQRRRLARHRQRHDPAASVPVGHLHPDRHQRAQLDPLGGAHIPGPALRSRAAGRLPRHQF